MWLWAARCQGWPSALDEIGAKGRDVAAVVLSVEARLKPVNNTQPAKGRLRI